MKIVSGFFVYKVYITYKAHFSTSTDISKYNFRLFNISYETFINTNGKKYYDKIAKKFKTEQNVISLFVSAFVDDANLWIGDISNNISYYESFSVLSLFYIV